MKIRKKLFLGFGLLFVVVMFFGAVSIYYIDEISETSKITLKNNYETLTFTKEMRAVLDENDMPLTAKAAQTFDQSLKKQENNITEPGEKAATAGVRKDFDLIIGPKQNLTQQQATLKNMRYLLKTIDGLNMKAIVDKDNSTHAIVDKTTFYLGAMAFVTFIILFVLVVGFPGFIINPLSHFAEGLEEIGEGNYDFRLDLTTSEEFTHLSEAFNTLATSLSERKNAGLTRVLAEEARIKALIEETPDAVIGINEKQEVLFMNSPAIKILDLAEIQVVGKSVAGLIKNSPLLKSIIDNKDDDEPLKVDQDGEISYFKQKSIEIVAPYVKASILDAVQYSGYAAGMIYILKEVPELVKGE